MRISLIMSTIGRTREIEKFLRSLNDQTYRKFELIIVDQNTDNRLAMLISDYSDKFPVIYVHSHRGISKGRNEGLKYITGDIVAFPDDDCWYSSNLLDNVNILFQKHAEWDGITGRSTDENGITSAGRFDRKEGALTIYNAWTRGISITIFLRRSVITSVGLFDENLGVGAGTPWGSAEETDYIIRAVVLKSLIYYLPQLVVNHPSPMKKFDKKAQLRVVSYAPGMGYVLRKHRYPLWFVIQSLIRPLLGAIVSLVTLRVSKSLCHWTGFCGRVKGWKDYRSLIKSSGVKEL